MSPRIAATAVLAPGCGPVPPTGNAAGCWTGGDPESCVACGEGEATAGAVAAGGATDVGAAGAVELDCEMETVVGACAGGVTGGRATGTAGAGEKLAVVVPETCATICGDSAIGNGPVAAGAARAGAGAGWGCKDAGA